MTLPGNASATVATENASRYMQQLCKHWSHKFAATFDAAQGEVIFPAARVTMTARPDRLDVDLAVEDADALDRMKKVVAEHLDRFAFREAPLPFVWS